GSTTAQGLYGASAVGGGGVALAVVPLAVSAFGWRAPYATALIVACVVLLCLRLVPRDRHKGEALRRTAAPIAEIVRDSRLYALAIAHTASFAFSVIVGNWTVSLLEHDGYGRRLGGAVAALTLLGGFVTRPLGGRAFQRARERAAPLLAASMIAGAAGTVLLLLDVPLALRILGAAILGLAAAIPFAAAFSGAQAIRPDAPGAAIGFINSCATLVIAVGTPLVGITFSFAGHGFEYAWTYDSHMLWEDSYATLPRAAAQTSKSKLGHFVTNPGIRDPTITASWYATMQDLSDGRMAMGIGRGDSSRRVVGLKPVRVAEFERRCAMIKDLMNGRSVDWNDKELKL